MDSNLVGWQFFFLDYVVIFWVVYNIDKLMIKFSFFCLGFLVVFGEGYMCDGGYLGLKLWRKMLKGYVQLVMGQIKKRLEKKDDLEDNV